MAVSLQQTYLLLPLGLGVRDCWAIQSPKPNNKVRFLNNHSNFSGNIGSIVDLLASPSGKRLRGSVFARATLKATKATIKALMSEGVQLGGEKFGS